MRDMRADLRGLHGRIATQTPTETGRVIVVVGAQAGDGASSVALSLALITGDLAERAVWLLDLDLLRNQAFEALSAGEFGLAAGEVGPAFAAGLKSEPFWQIKPDVTDRALASRLFTVHRVGDTRLMVTRFNRDLLQPRHRVRVRASEDYWRAVRLAAQWTIVDAPPLDQSMAALAVAPYADGVLLVVRADKTPRESAARLRDAVSAHGGRHLGVVLTGLHASYR